MGISTIFTPIFVYKSTTILLILPHHFCSSFSSSFPIFLHSTLSLFPSQSRHSLSLQNFQNFLKSSNAHNSLIQSPIDALEVSLDSLRWEEHFEGWDVTRNRRRSWTITEFFGLFWSCTALGERSTATALRFWDWRAHWPPRRCTWATRCYALWFSNMHISSVIC